MPQLKRKRARHGQFIVNGSPAVQDMALDVASIAQTTPRCIRQTAVAVIPTGLAVPRSVYEFWSPPSKPCQEGEAVVRLTQEFQKVHTKTAVSPEFISFQLDNFNIYRPDDVLQPKELISLDRLTRDRFPTFCFDGVLSINGRYRHYVQGIRFSVLTIDGYGDYNAIELTNQMHIQTPLAARANSVWYQLGSPAEEYKRFYHPFVWLARFAKHFVDYLLTATERTINLDSFRRSFYRYLCTSCNKSKLLPWLQQANRTDFRQTVIAYVDFLWKECYGLGEKILLQHPLWTEIGPQDLEAIPQQVPLKVRTVVTPFTQKCFASMYFSGMLEASCATKSTIIKIEQRKERLGLTVKTFGCPVLPRTRKLPVSRKVVTIFEGDFIAVLPDIDGHWKSSAQVWYAYVQGVTQHCENVRVDVLWLYQPCDTALGTANYPFANELFMSDNCGCDKNSQKDAIELDRIVAKVQVSWCPKDPGAEPGLFVRRKYRTHEDAHDFIALQKSDLRCECGEQCTDDFENCQQEYDVGDTVLILANDDDERLDPAQIMCFDSNFRQIQLRLFSRAKETVHPHSRDFPPNELIPEAEVFDCPPSKIVRRCHIRTFDPGKVMAPYDRGGAGDLFYVLRQQGKAVETIPAWKEGWHPHDSQKRMAGLGLFCGGGTFDRGLEEGGAVRFHHAVDWNTYALHTYRANASHKVNFFLGSVNDYLARALAGTDDAVAEPGTVNVIAAGSPCQGFSSMQLDKASETSLRNASMVASVIAFADLYAPEYLLLENVISMCSGFGPQKTQWILQQIMAALVALGYQVQTFLMDAWSYGSSQGRNRVFLIASAPEMHPLERPPHTHAHQRGGANARALGKLSNGLSFGDRLAGPTPFGTCQAIDAVDDLPSIGDGQPRICPQFPDHRLATDHNATHRERIAAVPRFPRGMSLREAYDAGLVRGEPREHIESGNKLRQSKKSRFYARIDPYGFFPTILTRLNARDAISGRVLHWDEDRVITIMEARRAQDYPDDEVIIGPPPQQLQIVGNSVDRKVSLALGRVLYKSWLRSKVKSPFLVDGIANV